MSWKKSAFVWSDILRLFVKTLTADNNYSRCNMQNFEQQVQAPLSQKEKTFSQCFIAYLKCTWNSKHFETKDEHYSLIISQIIVSERGGYLNVQKVFLQNTFRLSSYLRFPNAADIRTATLLSCCSMNSGYIELEKICLSLIWLLKAVC